TYCFFREERLAFGKGLSDPESPDLEARDLTGLLSLWIRVGKAEPSRVQKVADQNSRARVAVVFESPQRMEEFLAVAQKEKLSRLGRVEFLAMDPALAAGLAEKDERRHRLGVTIVGEHFYVEQGKRSLDGPLSRGSAP
ncbi:MAG TPA: YaeQ family protein, partial [Myxococcales bacterium]|nr:YaeQ family protein [Myxococcales bacterium]